MWQTWLGKCIYQSPSGYKVYQNLFYRWLTLGSDGLQTVIHRYNPHKPVLFYLPALTLMAQQYPGPGCLLGLGGAGAALMLAKTNPSSSLTAIECSTEIIDIAKDFFIHDYLPDLKIVHANAMHYIQMTEEQYQHVMVDLSDANNFPAECANDLFFKSCKSRVTESGFLTINSSNLKEHWRIFKLVKNHFRHTVVISVKKSCNLIIIASNYSNKDRFIQKISQLKQIKRLFWVDSWGLVAEIGGTKISKQ